MRYDLQNKVVFVSGAAAGIGKATAELFALEGAKVAVIDVQDAEGRRVADLIEREGGSAIYLHCDISKNSQVENTINEVIGHFGSLDIAFNNAGIEGEPAPTADCSVENFDKTIAVNLRGVWLSMKYQLQQMLRQPDGGTIINCSSVAGLVGTAGLPAYVASKHGVVGLTKAAALEYVTRKIRVNAVCPGVIDTPMITRFTGGDTQALKAVTANEPIGRMGTPREVAELVVWLASSNASFVTGQAIAVDGGWITQ